jgi:hypothetical protein
MCTGHFRGNISTFRAKIYMYMYLFFQARGNSIYSAVKIQEKNHWLLMLVKIVQEDVVVPISS